MLNLQNELNEQSYRPGDYRLFTIYDRKPRSIAAAPFRDRVVHHALMNQIEPALDGRFIATCYACRKGKGVHAAVRRYQRWSRQYAYALKLDVMSYFPSIDHKILKQKLRRQIKDKQALWLFDRIIDSAPKPDKSPSLFPGDDLVDLMQRPCGLPIGNLTSQFLGNLYLNDLDHFVTERCAVRAYLRYVDDMILLSNSKKALWQCCNEIIDYLQQERLSIHPHKIQLFKVSEGVDVLGYRVFPRHIRLRRDNGYRYRRQLRKYATQYQSGRVELSDISPSVAAWVGHAIHADSKALRHAVLSSVSFSRGRVRGEAPSCGSRRRLEQQTGEPPVGQPQPEHHR